MTREEALTCVKSHVHNQNLIKHMLATEAIMKALARRLNENEPEWGLTGLLHDIDAEATGGDPKSHSKVGADWIRELGVNETIVNAVLRHNEAHGIPLMTRLDKALFCADPLTGLIIAAALVRPDKKLAGLTLESVIKRFGEKRFAAGANREQIALCQEIGLDLEEFISLGLEAMKAIAPELGL